jgi:thymidine kinase
MIPPDRPNLDTGSERAEPNIYWHLKKQLSDDFVIIHSVPWLSSKAGEIDGRPVPTGEIDFLVLHPSLGILAVEVKGGVYGFHRTEFVYLQTGKKINPERQVSRGAHGLSKWLKGNGLQGVKIGYAIFLPDSEVNGRAIPPSLIDTSLPVPQTLVLDKRDIHNLSQQVEKLMLYWKKFLKTPELGTHRLETLIDFICPIEDYTPSWHTKIEFDNKQWLGLTEDQANYLKRLFEKNRAITTGAPGTGKTLLAISLARHLAEDNKKVLFLVFNTSLAGFLEKQLADSQNCTVMTFHKLCYRANEKLGKKVPKDEDGKNKWFSEEAAQALQKSVEQNDFPSYDALIIDEGQVFHDDWLNVLTNWFDQKKITVFCDETQVFKFEQLTTISQISEIIDSEQTYLLTLNQRSPKAVFDRLQQIIDLPHQQFSPRTFEPNTLEETGSENPAFELDKILTRLEKEGVSAKDVIILYHTLEPPKLDVLKKYHVTIEKIARFRGLEAPVVVIYAPSRIEDAPLFCAYSRATTRCIVIYDAYGLVKSYYGAVSQILMGSEQSEQIRQAASAGYTYNVLNNLNLSLQTIISRTVLINWCDEWAGWMITVKDEHDVATELWLDYLCRLTQSPIYYAGAKMRDEFRIVGFSPNLSDDRKYEVVELSECKVCAMTTPFKFFLSRPVACMVCTYRQTISTASLSSDDVSRLIEFDEILANPQKASDQDKLNLPVSLIALGRWQKSASRQHKVLSKTIVQLNASLAYRAAITFTSIDIVGYKEDEQIVLEDLARKYYKWSYDLQKQLSYGRWKNFVSAALELWRSRGLLEKLEKGIFTRTKTGRS